MQSFSAILALLSSLTGLATASQATGSCQQHELDFILLAGDTLTAQIEDDIRGDLEKLNFKVNTRLLEKADFNKAMQDGDFHLCFTESWGPPYDPHSFATGWFRPGNEAHYPAMEGMEAPMTKATMKQMVSNVLTQTSEKGRKDGWEQILQEMHRQALSFPMWSRRMPAVWKRRLAGYQPGPQQWDYPMHLIQVQSGPKTINVAPGAQTGLFKSTGPMDPHSYRPNEFFISNWIYEGLVSYGSDGKPAPQLAESWTDALTSDGGQEYTFKLRSGVKFHDGADFNCDAVKMNFDHVLQPPLNTLDYHGWYHLALHTKSWRCVDSSTFVVKLAAPYYPFLQELSLIRPLRILSPDSFVNGAATDPITDNSCPLKWGTPTAGSDSITCKGIRSFHGTGPWMFDSKIENGDIVTEMLFKRNPSWWGTRGDVEQIRVKHYPDENSVEAALLSGALDMVVGGGVLTPKQFQKFQNERGADFTAVLGPPLMNTIIVLNAAKAPTSDIELRKVIIHAVNKAKIVDEEMAGTAMVADSLFPKDAPYCDVDLTPRWDYDFEKAKMMNCPAVTEVAATTDDVPLIAGLVAGVVVLCSVFVLAAFCAGKRKGYKELEATLVPKNKQAPEPAVAVAEENQADVNQDVEDPAKIIGNTAI